MRVLLARRRLLIVILIFCSISLFGYYSTIEPNSYLVPFPFVSNQSDLFESGNLPIDSRCIIPSLEPDEVTAKQSLASMQKPDCSKNPPNPVRIANGFITVDDKMTDGQPISCSYSPVKFSTDFASVVESDDYLPLQAGRMVCPNETMVVRCDKKTVEKTNETVEALFHQPLRCIFQKPEVSARIGRDNKKMTTKDDDKKLNILMFGIDSMSHVSWLENLPNTTKYFTSTLGGVAFDGYNIVGDGTTAAILGILSGYMEEELHESRRGFQGALPIDDFPLIFRQLAEEGKYITAWDEEQTTFGTFHYRLLGFKEPPVDHYGRIFRLFAENRKDNDWDCFGSQGHLDEELAVVNQVFSVYPDPLRKFVLSFSSIYSHTSAGGGSQTIGLFDDLIRSRIESWKNKGFLKNTLLVLFADHGSRFSGSRASQRGKLSERLPFLGLAFPDWYKERFPERMENLRDALKKLTTPFDLHATLLDVAGLQPKSGTPSRAISFFQKIPNGRTCTDAGVLPHWCTCLEPNNDEKTRHLSKQNPIVLKCTERFQDFVNKKLLVDFIKNNQCLPVNVTEVIFATRFSMRREVATFVQTVDGHGRKPSFSEENNQQNDEYIQVSFTTSPGHGQWEVTFSHDTKTDDVDVNFKQISRTNRYGDAPKCIQDKFPYLRAFCDCKISK